MPIVKREDFGTDRVANWIKITDGICAMGHSTHDESSTVEMHYHDCHEFWFVLQGRALVSTEGDEHVVGPGDVVCTRVGDEHAILKIVEPPYSQVWIECALQGRKRRGHLHRGEDD
ncbi:MAG: cupin domain-containing protein [Armatimonadota bacterium]